MELPQASFSYYVYGSSREGCSEPGHRTLFLTTMWQSHLNLGFPLWKDISTLHFS
jgi:hypothetical protein